MLLNISRFVVPKKRRTLEFHSFGYLLGVFLDIFWVFVGYFLDIFWVFVGYLVDILLVFVGYLLNIFWEQI